jgi:hypothetical protein
MLPQAAIERNRSGRPEHLEARDAQCLPHEPAGARLHRALAAALAGERGLEPRPVRGRGVGRLELEQLLEDVGKINNDPLRDLRSETGHPLPGLLELGHEKDDSDSPRPSTGYPVSSYRSFSGSLKINAMFAAAAFEPPSPSIPVSTPRSTSTASLERPLWRPSVPHWSLQGIMMAKTVAEKVRTCPEKSRESFPARRLAPTRKGAFAKDRCCHESKSRSICGDALAGAISGGAAGRPTPSRVRRTEAGSVTAATILMRPRTFGARDYSPGFS